MKNHIEERRKARGMTQQQLASELGVSRQTIISLENGKYNPSILLAHSMQKSDDEHHNPDDGHQNAALSLLL